MSLRPRLIALHNHLHLTLIFWKKMGFYRSMQKPEITAYLKTYCGWSEGVRAIMRKHELAFEEKDIIKNPAFRWEMEQKSGQPLSPCVVVNGVMLPDISGEEVERYMLEQGLIGANDKQADAPTNSACSDEQHAAMALGQIPGKVKFVQ
jgi:glutaredoxin-related protein